MKPFQKANYRHMTPEKLVEEHGCTYKQAREAVERLHNSTAWKNDEYEVTVEPAQGSLTHLSIKCLDREPINDWRVMQEIKNAILGPECEAVELYPAESRLVDTANQYHLWGFTDPGLRFPFGYDHGREVTETPGGKAKQRPFGDRAGMP